MYGLYYTRPQRHIIRRLDRTIVHVDISGNGRIEDIENNDQYVAYVALEEDRIIGALTINRKGFKRQKTIESYATAVRPFRHRKGVAKQLWTAMIKAERPSVVKVRTVSDQGHSLVESLAENYPGIRWYWDSQKKSLRRKKKRKKRNNVRNYSYW